VVLVAGFEHGSLGNVRGGAGDGGDEDVECMDSSMCLCPMISLVVAKWWTGNAGQAGGMARFAPW